MTQGNETGAAGTPGRVRASDAEREHAVQQLREHFEAGRLDPEEFNERMESALGARYRDELPPPLADLPSEGIGAGRAHAGVGGRPAGPGPGWGGGPPWLRPGFSGSPWAWRRGPFVPFLPVLMVFTIVASIGAAAHGHFPFPLLWLGAALWWFRPWTHLRQGRSGRPGGGRAATTRS